MSDERTCEHCKHYHPLRGEQYGVCSVIEVGEDWVYSNHVACRHFHAKKVKPRRLCDFCERRRPIDDYYGRYSLEFKRLIPFPSINLTTGEQKEPERKIKYALFLYEDKDDGEAGRFPIKFCPLCGRKLTGEGKK